jgi:hypothetical protein
MSLFASSGTGIWQWKNIFFFRDTRKHLTALWRRRAWIQYITRRKICNKVTSAKVLLKVKPGIGYHHMVYTTEKRNLELGIQEWETWILFLLKGNPGSNHCMEPWTVTMHWKIDLRSARIHGTLQMGTTERRPCRRGPLQLGTTERKPFRWGQLKGGSAVGDHWKETLEMGTSERRPCRRSPLKAADGDHWRRPSRWGVLKGGQWKETLQMGTTECDTADGNHWKETLQIGSTERRSCRRRLLKGGPSDGIRWKETLQLGTTWKETLQMGTTERRPCRSGPVKGDPADGDYWKETLQMRTTERRPCRSTEREMIQLKVNTLSRPFQENMQGKKHIYRHVQT